MTSKLLKENLGSEVFFANFDYEFFLDHDFYHPLKNQKKTYNTTLEFLALLVLGYKKLAVQNEYSKTYLSKMQDMGFVLPELVDDLNQITDYWWGSRKNLELERTINNKTNLLNLFDETLLLPNTFVYQIGNEQFFQDNLDYLIKEEYSFSGLKTYVIKKGDNLKKFNKIYLAQPKVDVILDFSINYINDETVYFVNFIDRTKKSYQGGILLYNLDELCFYLTKKLNGFSLKLKEDFFEKLDILKANLREININNFSIDSYFYHSNGELKLCMVSEINYRKTMSQILYFCSKIMGLKNNPVLLFNNDSIQVNNLQKISPDNHKLKVEIGTYSLRK